MKVLTFISTLSLDFGGPSRSVPMLVKGLAELGVDITLMTIRSENMNLHAVNGTSAKVIILEPSNIKKQMRGVVDGTKYDIIQVQSVWTYANHLLIAEARRKCIPYIVTPRGMLEPWCLNKKKWKKRLALLLYQMRDLKKASCIFTTAESEAEHIRALGVDVPLSVIPNGIETEGYACRSSIDGVKKQVLFLSRISTKKGIEILIESWNILHKDYPEWQLLIVGNGEEEYINSLKRRIEDSNLQGCVKVLDPVFGEAKTKLYQESSLFCLPSYSENFGMVIAEAMSCGVPAITTNNTPWELLNGEKSTMGATVNKKTGWCIDLSVDNLTKALQEAMSMDRMDLFELGQEASRLINDNFNYRSVAKKTKALYEWIHSGDNKPDFVIL